MLPKIGTKVIIKKSHNVLEYLYGETAIVTGLDESIHPIELTITSGKRYCVSLDEIEVINEPSDTPKQ